jgi:threonine dehydrogenase-like Zn-dependent dehydrogenase
VLTEAQGPTGQMAAEFPFINDASKIITIDSNWRLDYVKSKYPKVELLDYSALPRGASVTSKLREMVPRGPEVAFECVAGEYAKDWAHYFELMLGMEIDTSEIVNETITSVKNFGRCGITGVYIGFVSRLECIRRPSVTDDTRQIISTSDFSWKSFVA